jgi:hypothetical protein
MFYPLVGTIYDICQAVKYTYVPPLTVLTQKQTFKNCFAKTKFRKTLAYFQIKWKRGFRFNTYDNLSQEKLNEPPRDNLCTRNATQNLAGPVSRPCLPQKQL